MTHSLRILAIAYACNPYEGSEPGVGWGWCHTVAPHHEVEVVTAGFQRDDIERFVADAPSKSRNLAFHYVPERPWHYRPNRLWKYIERSCLKPLVNLAYVAWQDDAYQLACQLHQAKQYDLIHLITLVGFRFPGRFWKLDIPLVWGPIGGLENTPWRFLPSLGATGCTYYACRNVINSLQRRFLPGPKRSFAKAAEGDGIIAATEGIRREIRRWYGHESQVICEIGPPPVVAREHSLRQAGEPLRLIWSGLHDPGKALPLLLKALAGGRDWRFEIGDWRLTILGHGPCTAKWKKLAARLGIAERCEWPGWIARDEAVRRMQQAHVGVITSMKDLTSTVLLECLAAGLPVICPDHCGFTNVITSECGIKLPVESPGQLIADMAAAVQRLAGDETQRRRLAAGALRRIGDFSWEKKAEAIDAIYRRAVERHRTRGGAATLAVGGET